MDLGVRSPPIDLFRRAEAPREARRVAVRGSIAPRVRQTVRSSRRPASHQAHSETTFCGR